MSPIRHRGMYILIILFNIAAISCSERKDYSGNKEGKIIYDVTYPLEVPSLILDLYPKEMSFYFKGDKMCSELRSSYDLLRSTMIINNQHKRYSQMVKSMRDKHVLNLGEKETRKWVQSPEDLRFITTKDTVEILGKKCSKVLAYTNVDNNPPLELYLTSDIDLSKENWWNQFSSLDGFLLGYDIDIFGKRLRMRAREIIFEQVNDMKFKVPEDYVEVNMAEMTEKMNGIVSEFVQK